MGFKGVNLSQTLTELNQIVRVDIEHNSYNGKVYASVSFVNEDVSRVENSVSKEEAIKFAASMISRLSRIPEIEGKIAVESPANKENVVQKKVSLELVNDADDEEKYNDDDMPF